jgi:hypothetical protein
MTDRPTAPDPNGASGDQTGVARDRGPTGGTPLWVKVFGVIALVLIVLAAISLIAGVRHGPGLHGLPGDSGGQEIAAGVVWLGHDEAAMDGHVIVG